MMVGELHGHDLAALVYKIYSVGYMVRYAYTNESFPLYSWSIILPFAYACRVNNYYGYKIAAVQPLNFSQRGIHT